MRSSMPHIPLALALAVVAPEVASAKDFEFYMAEAFANRAIPSDPAEIKRAYKYADCLIDYRVAVRLMRTRPASRESSDTIWYFTYNGPSCRKDAPERQYAMNTLRGPIAEHLLRMYQANPEDVRRTKPIMFFPSPSIEQLGRLPDDVRASILMVEYGSCVAKADPPGVAHLLATEAASVNEGNAFTALNPTMAACLPPGQQLKLTKFQLRGFVAEGAFRNAVGIEAGTGTAD
jgi:hypothetical protein